MNEAAARQLGIGMKDEIVGVTWILLRILAVRGASGVAGVPVDQHHRTFEQRRNRSAAAQADACEP